MLALVWHGVVAGAVIAMLAKCVEMSVRERSDAVPRCRHHLRHTPLSEAKLSRAPSHRQSLLPYTGMSHHTHQTTMSTHLYPNSRRRQYQQRQQQPHQYHSHQHHYASEQAEPTPTASGRPISRRGLMFTTGMAAINLYHPHAVCASSTVTPPDGPSDAAVTAAKLAFAAFDRKDLGEAETYFNKAISEWRRLGDDRPRKRDELCSLLIARANVRVDLKRFKSAVADFDEAINMMSSDGRGADGRAAYVEYADAFAQRGLAHEGLAGRDDQRDAGSPAEDEWRLAIADYDSALELAGPGGSPGGGPNPYILTYRGNAKASLGDYEGALNDFQSSEALFARAGPRASERRADALANEALALYALGRRADAIKFARRAVAQRAGFTDMRVMIAADAWDREDPELADEQWNIACNDISTGCRRYRDPAWLRTVRRWPQPLIDRQMRFLERTPPPPRDPRLRPTD